MTQHGGAGAALAALAALPLGVWVFGPDHRLACANPAAWQATGLDPEAAPPGTPLAALVRRFACRGLYGHGDPEALAAEQLRIDRTRPFRRRLRRTDGACFDQFGLPLPGGGFVIALFEVTDHVAAAEEVQARARRLETLLSRLHAGIAAYDREHGLLFANPAYEDLIGLPRGAVRPGMPHDRVYRMLAERGEFSSQDPEALVAERIRLDRSRPASYQRVRPNGQVLRVESQPLPEGGHLVEVIDITAAKRAEKEAQRRAALIDGVLASLPHGVVVYGPDGRVAMVNAAHQAIMAGAEVTIGEHREEITRRRAEQGEYGPGDPRELALAHLNAPPHRLAPRQRVRPNGTVLDIRYAPLPDGGTVQVTTDITALHAARTEATAHAAMLQAMLENMRHGIALYGPDRRLVASNRLALSLSGTPGDAIRFGMTLEEIVAAQHRAGAFGSGPEAEAEMARIIGYDRARPLRHQRTTPSGRIIEIHSDPTPDGGFVITWTDVTARAQAEAAAERRAALLQVALDSMRHGFILYDAGQRLVAANALAASCCGLAPEELTPGRPLAELLRLQQAAGVFGQGREAAEAVRALLSLDRRRPHEWRRVMPDGRVMEIRSAPTPDGGFVVTLTDITPLARAEAEAQQRAATQAMMLDAIRHGIALFGPDRRLIAANRLASELSGVPDSILRPGLPFEAAVRHQMAAAAGVFGPGSADGAVIGRALNADRSQPLRYQRRMPDGRLVEVVSDPMPDGGFAVTYSDITALARAEAEARRRAGVLQVMLDSIRHGICYYGPDRRVIAANALAADLAGYPPETLAVGISLDELIASQLKLGSIGGDAVATAAMARRLDRSRPARYVRPNADGRIVEVTSDPTPDGGFVVTMSDISALARAEAEAQHRAGVLQAMLDHIRHGIALFDREGRIQAVNPVFLALLDLPEKVMAAGGSFAGMIDHMQARGEYGPGEEGQAAAARLKERDRSRPARVTRTRPNGMVIEIASEPVPGGGFVLALTDVTEDRRIRAELERAKDAAEAANRAKSRFLATMSHELRTPLNAVIGFSEAIMADPDPVRGKDYARSIHEAGRHLLSLIDDILDVTRAETTGFAVTEGEVEVIPLIEGAVRVMQATAAAAGVTVQVALPPALPLLRADELRLRQVLLNLTSNAVKFTPQGGRVTISAAEEADGGVAIRVADSGIGMRPEDIPRAFEPFTQLDSSLSRRFPGSGLGLYLSRALAEAQGATLTLESVPGVGTTAILRFPKSRLPTSPAACGGPMAEAPKGAEA